MRREAAVRKSRQNGDPTYDLRIICEDIDDISECKRLLTRGASLQAANKCDSPMWITLHMNMAAPMVLAKWLILNGAMNGGDGHVDLHLVNRDTELEYDTSTEFVDNFYISPEHRLSLHSWCQEVMRLNAVFVGTVLCACVGCESHRCQSWGVGNRCWLPLLGDPAERVADFLGVERGRRLRNVREFNDELLELRPFAARLYANFVEEVVERRYEEEERRGCWYEEAEWSQYGSDWCNTVLPCRGGCSGGAAVG